MAKKPLIGSARIDERGKATGGKAGDQTGNEVGTQTWYRHSKGWRTFRARDPKAAEKIAQCMEAACKCKKIGYDQAERNTLYNAIKDKGFDISKLDKKVETDCSALVRVCLAYAGIKVGDFNTSSEPSKLNACPDLIEMTAKKYNTKPDYLQRGDIQVTKTKGHTIVVLGNGDKAEGWGNITPEHEYTLGERILKNGMEGADVRELQNLLIQLGYSCGSYGADGEFGDATEQAVVKFQKKNKCDPDGEVGEETIAAIVKALGDDTQTGTNVRIVGGSCYVRTEPNKTSEKLAVVSEGSVWPYAGEQSEDAWLKIKHSSGVGWVSGKYSRLE